MVGYRSAEYWNAVALRNEILRWPLGLELTEDDLDQERDETFFVAAFGDRVVGCLQLTAPIGLETQMRQVAVAKDIQRGGMGTLLVQAAETYARSLNLVKIVLHARELAVPFYRRLRYDTEGSSFMEVGVPHYRMFKMLKETI
jgi:predicted GNAT family N-acyltransferase